MMVGGGKGYASSSGNLASSNTRSVRKQNPPPKVSRDLQAWYAEENTRLLETLKRTTKQLAATEAKNHQLLCTILAQEHFLQEVSGKLSLIEGRGDGPNSINQRPPPSHTNLLRALESQVASLESKNARLTSRNNQLSASLTSMKQSGGLISRQMDGLREEMAELKQTYSAKIQSVHRTLHVMRTQKQKQPSPQRKVNSEYSMNLFDTPTVVKGKDRESSYSRVTDVRRRMDKDVSTGTSPPVWIDLTGNDNIPNPQNELSYDRLGETLPINHLSADEDDVIRLLSERIADLSTAWRAG